MQGRNPALLLLSTYTELALLKMINIPVDKWWTTGGKVVDKWWITHNVFANQNHDNNLHRAILAQKLGEMPY